ncbi:MAG: hypothetical protein WAK21_19795, partial [Candidatus Sulfotelmatobacter sp.]
PIPREPPVIKVTFPETASGIDMGNSLKVPVEGCKWRRVGGVVLLRKSNNLTAKCAKNGR